MDIVIVGGGKVGKTIAQDLSSTLNNVVLIDKDENTLDYILDKTDITGVLGNGAAIDVQMEAGVDSCDVFISVTELDELNIMACTIAHRLGAKNTIARVRSPEYAQDMDFVRTDLGITKMINPEKESAKKILQTLKFPSAYNVETFLSNKVNIVEYEINKDSNLTNKALKDIHLFNNRIIICIVVRNGQVFVPNGDFILKEGDRIHITGSYSVLKEFVHSNGYDEKILDKIFIIGGGQMAYYLISSLINKDYFVKVVEINPKRALELSEAFPKCNVILGDGTNPDVLIEERLSGYDALVTATDIDEENIILSLLSRKYNLKKHIIKVHNTALQTIALNLDLETIISPKDIIADEILRFIKSRSKKEGSKIEALHRMVQDQIFGVQFYISNEYKYKEVALKDLNFKKDTLVACIQRGQEFIYPTGDDHIEPGDHVLIITKNLYIESIDEVIV